ncbi:E3 ubiquitin-protein ligase TRIM13 isoform X3 [Hemicordylus capensis]|uniref:E3 ubiquitin-protein ligase TRIM13 isoform X3 n=1 Tax=Hemicordylus capensis TaxID=884348 RepID=UPI002304B686|nr:E3 ubiquitin-protein ligase TRIM13 isoform X3 [Hemicordylus capensis]
MQEEEPGGGGGVACDRSRGETAMELLEEDLTCPICCSLFDDPRALPCSHNFCKKCLEGILEGNARNMIWRQPLFKCPTCRKETTVTGVNNLQVNYSLKDAYLQEKLAFETLFKGFETWRCEDVLSRLDILESSKRKALQILTKDYDKVKEFFEKLQYALEQKKNEILSDFETMKLAVMQAYDPEINKLNTIVREQQMAFNIAEAFKDVSEPIIFLQQMQEFREKIKVIKETRLPCPTVDINSTMKDFDTSQWEQFKLADVDKLSLPQEKSTYNWAIPSPFSYKFIMAILFCLFILATTQVSIIDSLADTLQHCKTFISEYGSGYLTDTAEMAGHAVFYWEKITDSASVLSEKCVNYTLVMLDNVAQFVCKYKL